MLAARADGPWEDGLPFRGRYWLRQLGAYPHVGLSSATLAKPGGTEANTFSIVPELLRGTRSAAKALTQAAEASRASLSHHFAPGTERPRVSVPAGQTDTQLKYALQPYDHVKLLHVSLADAADLFRCYEQRQDAVQMRQLSKMLFQHEWCYRPVEMTEEWSAVDRRGKPKRGDEPWCVWGFKAPSTRDACSR